MICNLYPIDFNLYFILCETNINKNGNISFQRSYIFVKNIRYSLNDED